MAKIIKLSGASWIVGMVWRSFDETPSISEIRENAKEVNAKWYAVRNGNDSIQAGLSPPIETRRPSKGLGSLAAAVADARPQPWLGIFKISDDLFWYIAVRDGHSVLPDGDMIGTKEEIYAARTRHENFTDWSYVEGDLSNVEKLLAEQNRPKISYVRSIEPIHFGIPLALAAGIALASWGGWQLWQMYQQHLIQVAADEALKHRPLPPKIVSPLLTSPAPSTWLKACWAATGDVPISVEGWVLDKVSCAEAGATIDWKRQVGATIVIRPHGAVGIGGDSIEDGISFGPLPHGADNGSDLTSEKLALFALLQPLGVEATISAPSMPAPLPGAAPAASTPAAIQFENATFLLPVDPFDINFDQIPGFRFVSVEQQKSGWLVVGRIYGR